MVVGTIAGSITQQRLRSANLDHAVAAARPPQPGADLSADINGQALGSYVGRYTARGERKWLTLLEPDSADSAGGADRLAQVHAAAPSPLFR